MSQLLIKSQDIRYTKLIFVVQFTEDTMLPKQKAVSYTHLDVYKRQSCCDASWKNCGKSYHKGDFINA